MGTLPLKTQWADRGYHTLPAMKGEFYRFSRDQFHEPESPSNELARSEGTGAAAEELPLEREERATAQVLEQIYPVHRESREEPVERTPKKVAISKQPRFGALTASAFVQANNKQPGQEKRDGRFAAQRSIRQFRQQLLDRFATMSGAFECFAAEMSGGMDRELTRKDFSRFLNKNFRGLSRDDHAQVFDFLDTDRSGTVSVNEFHQAIEATAPVRTIEDLRRKLIALGYSSMRQAIKEMDHDRGGKKLLTVQELGQALTRLGVVQEDEHASVFQLLCDPHGAHGRQVTLDQLAAAFAAVSPSLLLEDIRDRLIKRYGNLSAAFAGLDMDCSLSISAPEFIRQAQGPWRLDSHEASKAWAVVDTDRSNSLSRREFISALSLVEPSLFHEDIRRKVRQRFRSIAETLLKDEFGLPAGKRPGTSPASRGNQGVRVSLRDNKLAMQTRSPTTTSLGRGSSAGVSEAQAAAMLEVFVQGGALEDAMQKKTPLAFQELLSKVQLTEAETSTLFQLVDVDRDGTLDPVEFVRGIRIFAPSTMLDDLRLRCLASHPHVAEAFAAMSPREHSEVLNVAGLRQALESLGLAEGIDVQAIMDLVEPHKDGGLTISELVSALQAATPGGQTPLSPDVRDARARQQVKATMAPFFSCARELRSEMRQQQQFQQQGRSSDRSFSLPMLESSALSVIREETSSGRPRDEVGLWSHVPGAPPPLRQSYEEVSRHVGMLPAADSQPIMERIHGYYKSAGSTVIHDNELLKTAESRFQQYRSITRHTSAIERPATSKVADSPKAEQPP